MYNISNLQQRTFYTCYTLLYIRCRQKFCFAAKSSGKVLLSLLMSLIRKLNFVNYAKQLNSKATLKHKLRHSTATEAYKSK